MELMLDTENWREELAGNVAEFALIEGDENYWADVLCQITLDNLTARGVNWSRAYQQSVGAFVIVQRADDLERNVFLECLEVALAQVAEEIKTVLAKQAEATQ